MFIALAANCDGTTAEREKGESGEFNYRLIVAIDRNDTLRISLALALSSDQIDTNNIAL